MLINILLRSQDDDHWGWEVFVVPDSTLIIMSTLSGYLQYTSFWHILWVWMHLHTLKIFSVSMEVFEWRHSIREAHIQLLLSLNLDHKEVKLHIIGKFHSFIAQGCESSASYTIYIWKCWETGKETASWHDFFYVFLFFFSRIGSCQGCQVNLFKGLMFWCQ